MKQLASALAVERPAEGLSFPRKWESREYLRGSPEIGTRAAARTVAKPFRFTKVPVLWGFWQSGAAGW